METFTFEPQRFSWCTRELNSGLSGIDKNETRFSLRWKSLSVKFVSRVALKGNRFIIPGLISKWIRKVWPSFVSSDVDKSTTSET